MRNKEKFTFIDLFAGAGGLSEGFIRKGFIPVAHIEKDKNACLTLKTRLAYHHLKCSSRKSFYTDFITGKIIRDNLYSKVPQSLLDSVINLEITDNNIEELFIYIKKLMKKVGIKHIDAIIGGPPCQAYSVVGRAVDKYNKKLDSRNYLYKQYARFLKEFNPNLFVFENVPGILSAGDGIFFEDIKKGMAKAGYEIEARILNALDFGVLQQRKRIILIGWKRKNKLKYPDFKIFKNSFRVDDLLSDIPSLAPGNALQVGDYRNYPSKYLILKDIRKDNDVLIQHISRVHNNRDREIYRIAIDMWNKEKRRLKYTDLPRHLMTHKNEKSFLDRFKVVADDMPYSHTVIAHIAKDGHSYIHPDIKQLRSLTVREAARIQSFPDDYFFEGTRTSMFTQIGNAVPPLMAEGIAEKIKEMLS